MHHLWLCAKGVERSLIRFLSSDCMNIRFSRVHNNSQAYYLWILLRESAASVQKTHTFFYPIKFDDAMNVNTRLYTKESEKNETNRTSKKKLRQQGKRERERERQRKKIVYEGRDIQWIVEFKKSNKAFLLAVLFSLILFHSLIHLFARVIALELYSVFKLNKLHSLYVRGRTRAQSTR